MSDLEKLQKVTYDKRKKKAAKKAKDKWMEETKAKVKKALEEAKQFNNKNEIKHWEKQLKDLEKDEK